MEHTNTDTVTCLIVKPNELPSKVVLGADNFAFSLGCNDNDLTDYFPFQKDPNVCVLFDENAKQKDKSVNRAIYADDDYGFFQKGQIIDIICGSFIVTKTNDNGELVSLDDNEIKHYTDMFKNMDLEKKYSPLSKQERMKEPVSVGMEYSFSR